VLDMLASYGYIELENIGSKNALIGVKWNKYIIIFYPIVTIILKG
jgi:hypothetical protein